MSITEKILILLATPKYRYKGVPVNCFGMTVFNEYKKQSVKNTFSKLNTSNYISRSEGNYMITPNGEKYLNKRNKFLKTFNSPFKNNSERNLLVLFDITEGRKIEREWLRRHLRKFDYHMIQRSVWVGPSPLPKEFISYIKKLNLKIQ